MVKQICVCFLMFYCGICYSNHNSDSIIIYSNSYKETYGQLDINLAYHPIMLMHPGIRAGIEFPLRTNNRWPKLDFIGEKSKERNSYLGNIEANLVVYYHKKNHGGLLINALYNYRYVSKWGYTGEFGVGIGHIRTFLGETYVVDDQGDVNRAILAGRSYFSPVMSMGLGKDLWIQENVPLALYYKTYIYLYVPYNHVLNINVAVEFGIRFHLKTF